MNLKKEYLRSKAVAETSLNAAFKKVAENKITGKTKYLINDDNRLGIVVGKWESCCHKKDKNFFVKRTYEELIIRDDLMEIHVTASKKEA